MLNPELIPLRLVSASRRAPLQIDRRTVRASQRTAVLAGEILLLVARIGFLYLVRRLTRQKLGTLLKEFCQRMGVLWIKVGQLLSMRADLAPPEVRSELAKLQDRVKGFPGEEALLLVERELGRPWASCFAEFDVTPLAAASIGQVHRARLKRENVEVAVKVQRPEVEQIYQRDMRMVRLLIWVLELVRFRPHARLANMLWEIEEAMREELDYRYEASNMRRLKKTLTPHGVYAPIVYDECSTQRILTMEFVRGVLMSDYLAVARTDPPRLAQWHEANRVIPRLVAKRLLHSFLRQAFEDDLFHSDLHPGNIVLLRDSRIAFLDFGSAGTMERDFRRKVDMFIEAMGTRQYSKAVDLFFLFSDDLPSQGIEDCKRELVRRLLIWDNRSRVTQLPFEVKTLNRMMDEMVFVAAGYGVAPVWSFFRMTRAMATMDASLQELFPEADFHNLIIGYHRGRAKRLRGKIFQQPMHGHISLQDWLEVQQQLMEDAVYRGSVVRRTAQVFEATTSKVMLLVARLFAVGAGMAQGLILLLLFAVIYQHHRDWQIWMPTLPYLDALLTPDAVAGQTWLLALVLLAYVQNRLARLSKVFARPR
nr:serine/threonine protein kinase [uncultured bacterium]